MHGCKKLHQRGWLNVTRALGAAREHRKVAAGGERLASTGDDNHPTVGIGSSRLEGMHQLSKALRPNRIAFLGAIQRQSDDALVALPQNALIAGRHDDVIALEPNARGVRQVLAWHGRAGLWLERMKYPRLPAAGALTVCTAQSYVRNRWSVRLDFSLLLRSPQ